MNKTELIKLIAERRGLPQRAAGAAVNAVLQSVASALQRGERVQVRGFGSLTPQEEREARGGKKGTPQRTVVFKAAKALLDALKSGAGPPRRHPRVPFRLRVESEHLETLVTEYTQNISKGGVFISSDRELDAGSELVFKLYVPMYTEPLTVKGRVAWVRGDGKPASSKRGMGIEFVYDMEEEEFVKDRIVEALMRQRQEP